MNAARLTRSLEHSGFSHEQAVGLSESLADEIERTVATTEHVELAVTREVGSLRHELQSQIAGLRQELQSQIAGLRTELQSQIAGSRNELQSQIAELRTEQQSQIAGSRNELQSQIGELRAEIIGTVGELKVSMIKWTVGLLVGQFGIFLLVGGMLWGR